VERLNHRNRGSFLPMAGSHFGSRLQDPAIMSLFPQRRTSGHVSVGDYSFLGGQAAGTPFGSDLGGAMIVAIAAYAPTIIPLGMAQGRWQALSSSTFVGLPAALFRQGRYFALEPSLSGSVSRRRQCFRRDRLARVEGKRVRAKGDRLIVSFPRLHSQAVTSGPPLDRDPPHSTGPEQYAMTAAGPRCVPSDASIDAPNDTTPWNICGSWQPCRHAAGVVLRVCLAGDCVTRKCVSPSLTSFPTHPWRVMGCCTLRGWPRRQPPLPIRSLDALGHLFGAILGGSPMRKLQHIVSRRGLVRPSIHTVCGSTVAP